MELEEGGSAFSGIGWWGGGLSSEERVVRGARSILF